AGWGSGASPLIAGYGDLHARLEESLARFEGCQEAILFPSGYAANSGTIAALVGPGDVIFSDARNHASIIDGCRLSGAKIEVYPHVDMGNLRDRLVTSASFRRRLIVTDTLFSMEGDLAPLPDLATLAAEHDAILMVDEAHATGVLGATGRGVCQLQQVEEGVHVRVGTLSKGLGSAGGFVAGSEQLVQWLVNRARPYIFSTASPAALAAAGLRALEIVDEQPERREDLMDQAAWLHDQLIQQGWPLGSLQSQIFALPVGRPERALDWSQQLREAGFLVPAIRPPSVAEGASCLRLSLCYGHPRETLEGLVQELGRFAPLLNQLDGA
ncbi:MAG: 8-amino-7-oxononanoate synthase, partial [Pirellulaceae bacterium]